jgi:Cysteine-rich CWC
VALRPAKQTTEIATDRCPRCDATFGCAIASGRCWCAEITLTPERQAQLATDFDGCLCPTCLRELEHTS